MNYRPWKVNRPVWSRVAQLANAIGAPELLAGLLMGRGVTTPEQAMALLTQDASMGDPCLMKDMDKAVVRIRQALDAEEPIVIFGDYDVDGITATALLYSHLSNMGGKVRCKLPTREGDGYGLSREALERLREKGFTLVVTVDNGISAVEETRYAKELGIDLVITDHHLPPEQLPDAVAVVNPMRSDDNSGFRGLSGAGVAFMLCAALDGCSPEEMLDYCGDLAAIGTVADVMPLTGKNRTLVRHGLSALANTERPGLAALLEVAGAAEKPVTAETISYVLAPRLNAAGRMGDPSIALKLLLCEDEEQAAVLASRLAQMNAERQQAEQKIMAAAQEQLEQHPERLQDRVILVWGEGYHPGVIGIVASRMVERYGRPAIIISVQNGEGRGSGRSVAGFNLYDAIAACSDLLIRFGGHPLAAGLSMAEENIEELRSRINRWSLQHWPVDYQPELALDVPIFLSKVNAEAVQSLDYLAPYGHDNPTPVFLVENVVLDAVWSVSNGKHCRLRLVQGNCSLYAVYFGMAPEALPYEIGSKLDVAVSFTTYQAHNGMLVSGRVRDLRPAGLGDDHCRQAALFESFRAGIPLGQSQYSCLLPSREDTAALYRLLRTGKVRTGDLRPVFASIGEGSSAGKILAALTALQQLGLVQIQKDEAGHEHYVCVPADQKKNLDSAPVLYALRQQIQGRE